MTEYKSDTIDFLLAPHSVYTCSERMLRQIDEKAKELSLRKEIHLAESLKEYDDCMKAHGKTPVRYLADLGFLDEKTILAHCVRLEKEDYSLLKSSCAHVVTNPASNAKLGNGAADFEMLYGQGVRICLGTDGAASNNTQNLFREMNFLSLLHKARNCSPTAASAQAVLRLATANAAEALGKKIGRIEAGCLADLVFLDKNAISLMPANDLASALVYSANGSEVDSVMINGAFVFRKKEFTTIDRDRVLYEVARIAKKYL